MIEKPKSPNIHHVVVTRRGDYAYNWTVTLDGKEIRCRNVDTHWSPGGDPQTVKLTIYAKLDIVDEETVS
jgi:hypothetical protein